METVAGLSYLATAVLLVIWAIRNKSWSWYIFGWVILLSIVVGAPSVWAAVVLDDRIGPSRPLLGVASAAAAPILGVAIITAITVWIARRRTPPA